MSFQPTQSPQPRLALGSPADAARFSNMNDRTFQDGYRDGWEAGAGLKAMPDNPTPRQEGEADDYNNGFRYGKADAAERYTPTL